MKERTKIALVTGSGQGIGKAVAIGYAKEGYDVVVAEINEEKGLKTLEEIKKISNGIFVKTDVSKEEDIKSLMENIKDTYGTLDIIINNAGLSRKKPIFELEVSEWDEIINTNLRSVFICSKEGAKLMKSGGSIVNIASTRAIMSESDSEAYAATKGGILALTHALAVSLSKYNINVNAISPGWIETENYEDLREIDHDQHLSKRVGKPEDIARACIYLTNPENNFVNGTNLVIDGGMTKKMIYEH